MTIKGHACRAQVDFIQYGESSARYHGVMAQTVYPSPRGDDANIAPDRKTVPAAGLFGYSIRDGNIGSFKETEGYLRDMEQMPHFAPPSVSNFVAQYLASNIGKTHSSS